MTAKDSNERICLGVIIGAQGIRGEVIIRSFTESPENIGDYGALTDSEGAKSYELKVLRVTKKGVVTRVKGVDDRNQAEALKGTELYVLASLLPQPEAGEFYYLDLIGLAAVDDAGKKIGEVVSVQNFGAGDLLEIRLEGTETTEFLPFDDDCVPKVSLEDRQVIIKPPEGLWD